MQIPTVLSLDRLDVVRGLMTGRYQRWGGVVRVAAGHPGAGRIVTMLREAAPNLGALVNPAALPLKGLDIVVNAHGHHKTQSLLREGFANLSQRMGMVLGISSVGAVASVLNLGLTAAGFLVMSHKLDQLRSAQAEMHRLMKEGFDALSGKLDDLGRVIVELRVIAFEQHALQEEILRSVEALHQNGLIDKFASLAVAAKGVERLFREGEGKHDLHRYLDTIEEIRLSFETKLDCASLDYSRDPRAVLTTCQFYQGWSSAAMAEVMVERRRWKLDKAADKARAFRETARRWTGRWTGELFPRGEWGGVRRFGHSSFHARLGEQTRRRLYSAERGDDFEATALRRLEREGSDLVSRDPAHLTEEWIGKQTALAHLLERIEETTERLESLSWEAAYCAGEWLTPERWEMLPPASDDCGQISPLLERG